MSKLRDSFEWRVLFTSDYIDWSMLLRDGARSVMDFRVSIHCCTCISITYIVGNISACVNSGCVWAQGVWPTIDVHFGWTIMHWILVAQQIERNQYQVSFDSQSHLKFFMTHIIHKLGYLIRSLCSHTWFGSTSHVLVYWDGGEIDWQD